MKIRNCIGAVLAGAFYLGACQPLDAAKPAVLESADEETMTVLHAALADALGRAQVELGPGDPTQTPDISVLPPPLGPNEDRSLAQPVQFHLILEGDQCILVRHDTGEGFFLSGVRCIPFRDEG